MSKPVLRELALAEILEPAAPSRGADGFGNLEELAESIRAVGVIEPLVVAKRGAAVEVVAGHRRYLAAKMIGLLRVPCVVHDDFQAAEEAVMLHENLYRTDLNPVDEARFFSRLLGRVDGDTGRLAELVRARRDHVESRLQLLRGDPDVLAALERGAIGVGVAAELNLYLHDATRRAHLAAAEAGGARVGMVRAWRQEANRFYELQQTRVEPAADAPPAEPTPAPANPFVCFFCGSDEHVETMQQTYLHKSCVGLLKSALGDRFR